VERVSDVRDGFIGLISHEHRDLDSTALGKLPPTHFDSLYTQEAHTCQRRRHHTFPRCAQIRTKHRHYPCININ